MLPPSTVQGVQRPRVIPGPSGHRNLLCDSPHDSRTLRAEGIRHPCPSSMGKTRELSVGKRCPCADKGHSHHPVYPHSVSQLGCPMEPRCWGVCQGLLQTALVHPVTCASISTLTSLSLIQDHWMAVHGDTPTTGLNATNMHWSQHACPDSHVLTSQSRQRTSRSCGTQFHSLLG